MQSRRTAGQQYNRALFGGRCTHRRRPLSTRSLWTTHRGPIQRTGATPVKERRIRPTPTARVGGRPRRNSNVPTISRAAAAMLSCDGGGRNLRGVDHPAALTPDATGQRTDHQGGLCQSMSGKRRSPVNLPSSAEPTPRYMSTLSSAGWRSAVPAGNSLLPCLVTAYHRGVSHGRRPEQGEVAPAARSTSAA